MSNTNGMNCPFGTIKSPIDLWYCKITREACPIQAWIDLPAFASFDQYCKADESTKTGVKETIRTGRYKGELHLPGRYLCPLCKPSKGPWRYFPESELYWLKDYIDTDSYETRAKILKAGIPLAACSSKICKGCLVKVLDKLGIAQM
ncbi:MAG: hypothetical protein E3J66_03275 [Dehalococcoidia bacterium]|nr:MAG: hypothetical protein E3J66_03275 [Dehalococcoidia bacterium]